MELALGLAFVKPAVVCGTGTQCAQGRWVVIKTHYWSDKWEPSQADHIFLTHRELSEVVASYKRVGWAFNIPDSYVREHQQWQVQLAIITVVTNPGAAVLLLCICST